MKEQGFYIVSDQFFIDFPDPYLKGNKEETRPHYYAFRDRKTNLFWLIPLSSKVEKYQNIINKCAAANKKCDFLHIATLNNQRTSVFVIGDMFPVTEKYIVRPFTINNNPFILKDDKLAQVIAQKARRCLALLRKGYSFSLTQPNVLFIEQKLLEN